MVDLYTVPVEKLTSIADAIRLKRDMVDEMSVDDMPMQIGLIGGGREEIVNIPYSSSVTTVNQAIEYIRQFVDSNGVYVKKVIDKKTRELTMFAITNESFNCFRYGSESAIFNGVSGTTAISLPDNHTEYVKTSFTI